MKKNDRQDIRQRQNALAQDLNNEDDMGIVIRAHIHVEHELIGFIETKMSPQSLKSIGLDYSGHVKLAIALGFDKRIQSSLNYIGSLRNRFAHRLDASLSEEDAKSFWKVLAAEEKHIAQTCYEATWKGLKVSSHSRKFKDLEFKDRIRLSFVVLWTATAMQSVNPETF